jgi:hypothetical protein
MRAIVYANQLGPGKDFDKRVLRVLQSFIAEAEKMIALRNCQIPECYQAVMDEQNGKWRALCRILEKRYKQPVLKLDGFAALIHENPALWNFWKTGVFNEDNK